MDSELPQAFIEHEFQATKLDLHTPANSDTLAVLIPDRSNPNKYHYKRLVVRSEEQASQPGTDRFGVQVTDVDLGEEVIIEGYIGDLVGEIKQYEERMRQSPIPEERRQFAAVGVVAYAGQGMIPLELLVQLAGIRYHQERQNFLRNSSLQA